MEDYKQLESTTTKTYIRDGRSPIPKRESISIVMSANKAKNSKPEIYLRKALWKENMRGYRIHPKKISGRPDIAFTSKNIALFVNGCFWHRCPHCKLELPKTNQGFWRKKFEANMARDKNKIKELKSKGWICIVIWECEIKKNVSNVVKKLKKNYANCFSNGIFHE